MKAKFRALFSVLTLPNLSHVSDLVLDFDEEDLVVEQSLEVCLTLVS